MGETCRNQRIHLLSILIVMSLMIIGVCSGDAIQTNREQTTTPYQNEIQTTTPIGQDGIPITPVSDIEPDSDVWPDKMTTTTVGSSGFKDSVFHQ